DSPIQAASLSDFWGKRWNLAFRDLAYRHVFRPVTRRLGVAGATMAVFLVSGVVHDAVISIPAAAGFGLPTLYFVIQGAGVLFERSRFGKRIGISKGKTGRVFCAAIILGPVLLLFHRPFVERVIVPMLTVLKCEWG
ncbi:MAG: membrane bound O-acyl transferase family-domain-containing protein, partial [Planctomycetales bacterium]